MVASCNSISSTDISYLREVFGSGNPVGVSRDKRTYRAKVLKRILLGSFPNEQEACRAVVKWYKERYGAEWKAVLASRHINPVRYVKRPEGGFTVKAWMYGEMVDVRLKLGKQIADYFPTLTIAKAAFSQWLHIEFGMFAAISPVFLYRVSDKFRNRVR